jgi:hypothetical protein
VVKYMYRPLYGGTTDDRQATPSGEQGCCKVVFAKK